MSDIAGAGAEPGVQLRGEVVVVTGAGSGLGRGAALHLAALGAEVVALSLVPEELQSLEQEAVEAGTPLTTLQVDVGDAGQVHEAVAEILERHSQVDVLINNAGVIVLKPIEEMSVEEWDRVVTTNLRSVFLTLARAGPVDEAAQEGPDHQRVFPVRDHGLRR